jgi:hypothetical protein
MFFKGSVLVCLKYNKTKITFILGVPLDPKIVRQMADQMKNASDDDFEKMKNQYKVYLFYTG